MTMTNGLTNQALTAVSTTGTNYTWEYSTNTSFPDPFRDLLNELFYPDEKIDYLKSLGYIFRPVTSPNQIMSDAELGLSIYKVNADDQEEFVFMTVNELFKVEMRSKLRHLLLEKQVLKLNIRNNG